MKEHLLVSPEKLKIAYPLPMEDHAQIATWRQEILAILQGHDPRLLLIVGPCSIHNFKAAYEYALRLKQLADDVKDTFFIVMRAYFEKPRTAPGWKGFISDPHLDDSHDIATGLQLTRQLLLDIAAIGLPAATEFLQPLAAPYFSDLISWGSIGARTVQSPIHRELASNLPMPVGLKNRTDGQIESAIQAALIAKQANTFLAINEEGKIAIQQSPGNSFPHIVLRGGENSENYNRDCLTRAVELLKIANLPPSLIVDCAHGNSKKELFNQKQAFDSLIEEISLGNRYIRGLMLESFLLESTQDALKYDDRYLPAEIAHGASRTDPCLGWDATATLIKAAALQISIQDCVLFNDMV